MDPLCGPPNRIYFSEWLEAVIEEVRVGRAPAALFYIDLDHFKDVNDTLGHQDRRLRRRDPRDLAQNAPAKGVERTRRQLPLVRGGDFVGAPGGREHVHHDANDGNGHDHADRHHHAQARAVPIGVPALLGRVAARRQSLPFSLSGSSACARGAQFARRC
ncbi:MAG: diguanylate cyclase [Pseudolabrys sp.]